MHLKDETYYFDPHMAKELQKFHGVNLSNKQVQQFLGIGTYLGDFV